MGATKLIKRTIFLDTMPGSEPPRSLRQLCSIKDVRLWNTSANTSKSQSIRPHCTCRVGAVQRSTFLLYALRNPQQASRRSAGYEPVLSEQFVHSPIQR